MEPSVDDKTKLEELSEVLWGDKRNYAHIRNVLKLALSPSLTFMLERNIQPWLSKSSLPDNQKSLLSDAFETIRNNKNLLSRLELCKAYGMWPFDQPMFFLEFLRNEKVYNHNAYILEHPVFVDATQEPKGVEPFDRNIFLGGLFTFRFVYKRYDGSMVCAFIQFCEDKWTTYLVTERYIKYVNRMKFEENEELWRNI